MSVPPTIVLAAGSQIEHIQAVAQELRAYLDMLLAMPRTDGIAAEVQGANVVVGASEIYGLSATNIGGQAGHDGLRERAILLTCYVRVIFRGTHTEDLRLLAMARGVFATVAYDAGTTTSLQALNARPMTIQASNWTQDAGANNRDVVGTFVASAQCFIQVAE